MTRTHRTANSHSRSSVRMSSSRKVSASWNTWNSPNSDNDVHEEIQAIMAARHPWNGWNGQRSGHGWTSFGPNQGHGANWNSWGMWNHLSPTPDRGNVEHRSQWNQWNNAQNDGVHRNPQNVIPGVDHNIQGNNIIPNRQGIGGQQWTSWNGPRGWASWAARFSKGPHFSRATPMSLFGMIFGRQGSIGDHRVYEPSNAKDYYAKNNVSKSLAPKTSSNEIQFDSVKSGPKANPKHEHVKKIVHSTVSKASFAKKVDIKATPQIAELNALAVSPEPKILLDSPLDFHSATTEDGNSSITTESNAIIQTNDTIDLKNDTVDGNDTMDDTTALDNTSSGDVADFEEPLNSTTALPLSDVTKILSISEENIKQTSSKKSDTPPEKQNNISEPVTPPALTENTQVPENTTSSASTVPKSSNN